MRVMRLKTVYCRPRTTVIDPVKYKYPYLLRNIKIDKPNQVWSRYYLYSYDERVYVLICDYGCLQ